MIEAGVSYSISTKSDFVYNLILGHLYSINKQIGVTKGKTLFGRYLVVSDTFEPTEKRVVVSRKKRENLQEIDASKVVLLIPIVFEILGIDNKEMLKYCKDALKKKHIDSIYYYIAAMQDTCIVDGSFNEAKAKYVVHHHIYKGVHTITEKYKVVLEFASNPDAGTLYHMLNVFNDENGGFDSLVHIISVLVEGEKIPEYIVEQHASQFDDFNFIRSLLNISIALLKTKTKEEFAMYVTCGLLRG